MNINSRVKRLFVTRILRRTPPLSLCEQDIPIRFRPVTNSCFSKDRVWCNMNIDDLCPKNYDAYGLDFGGNIHDGLVVAFRKLLEEFPHVAVTFFVIPNASLRRHSWSGRRAKDDYDISLPNHAEWMAYYKELAQRFNIEYALHGCHHWQDENPLFGRYTEFAFKRESETRRAVIEGIRIFRRADWEACGFRPPGWDINSDLSLCNVLHEMGFTYLAGSTKDAGLNARRHRVDDYGPTWVGSLINFPQNITVDEDWNEIQKRIGRIVAQKGILSIKAHFVDREMPNCLSVRGLDVLRRIFDYLKTTYDTAVEYLTFREMADRIRKSPEGK